MFLATGGPLGASPLLQGGAFVGLFAFMLFTALEWKGFKVSLPTLIAWAVLLRLLFLFFPVSDDFARYAWEGKIQRQGFNPYITAPQDTALIPYQDSLWQHINHKEYTAIYPPGFLALQKLLAYDYPSPLPWKLLLIVADFFSLFLFASILNSQQKKISFLALFALNPFCLVFFNGEAHVDGLLVFLGALCIWSYQQKFFRLMWLTVGIATQIKYFPILWTLALFHKQNWKSMGWMLLPLVSILGYLDSGISPLLKSLFAFRENFEFNNLYYGLFQHGLPLGNFIFIFILWTLVGVYLLVQPDRIKNLLFLSLATLLSLPTIHPWYMGLLLPFWILTFRWSIATLLVSLFLGLLPLYTRFQTTGQWQEILEARGWIWLPFSFILLLEIFGLGIPGLSPKKTFGQKNSSKNNETYSNTMNTSPLGLDLQTTLSETSFSIIIPTLNESAHISKQLEQLQSILASFEHEIIIVDGGSQDGTPEIAQKYGVKVLHSPKKGRGYQQGVGLDCATKEIAVFLHADQTLPNHFFKTLSDTFSQNQESWGGWHQMQFSNHHSIKLKFLEVLNFFRAKILLIGFGDQVLFCKTELAKKFQLMYRSVLMEDVYFSLRLKELSSPLVINSKITVSARKWKKAPYAKSVLTIFWIVFVFCISYRLGFLNPQSNYYLHKYYGKKK